VGILDLEPRRHHAIREMRTVLPFRNDAFEISATDGPVEIDTALNDMIQVQKARLDLRHDRTELPLALDQSQTSKVVGPAIRTEADDLTVEDRLIGSNRVGEFFCQLVKLVDVPAAADDLASKCLRNWSKGSGMRTSGIGRRSTVAPHPSLARFDSRSERYVLVIPTGGGTRLRG
jgi:hypothetical protein